MKAFTVRILATSLTVTTCLISAFLPGTSAAQALAADDLVEHCPSAVPESVCQPDPKIMEQHIEKAGVTSGRGKGKISGKRMTHNPMLSLYKYKIQAYNPYFQIAMAVLRINN